MPEDSIKHVDFDEVNKRAISQPLVSHMYNADPSAHVFDGKIYIYPSHDVETSIEFNDNGDHFDMYDYHILSMNEIGGEVTDHGVALDIKEVPWAGKQMWAPDAASKDGKYYFYFPAKDKNDMYFGGIWGGQLQRYRNNKALEAGEEPKDHEPALSPKVGILQDDMLEFAEEPKDLLILDERGDPIKAGDHDIRFFEAAWMHKYEGKYYFSYSTGNTHKICYAISDNPYGPFVYKGVILKPVVGWTTHHSNTEFKGKWYLFYHDSLLSNGITHLRSAKCSEIKYDTNGNIRTLDPYQFE